MYRYFLLFSLLCLVSGCATKTSKSDDIQVLSPKQMKEDVLFFYEKILETHPNPYQVLTPEMLDMKIQELLNSLDKPLSVREFSLKITPLNAYFDGHTQIYRAKEVYEYAEKWLELPEYFIEMKNGTFFFAQDHPYLDSALYGKRIIKMNDVFCEKLIALTQQHLSFESHQDKQFPMVAIVLLKNLLCFSDTIHIEYESNNGIEVVSFVPDDFKEPKYLIKKEKKEKPFDFKHYKQESIAILELNTFTPSELEKESGEFEKAIAKIIDSITKSDVKHFFIDIASNRGGNSQYANQVLDFLVNDTTNFYWCESIIKLSPKIKRSALREHRLNLLLSKEYRKNKVEIRSLMKIIKKMRFFQQKYHWQPSGRENIYKNNVYLIQSGSSYSAAVNLSSFVKAYKTAIIIGEETGGKTSGYINMLTFTMKNSKMTFTCSVQYFEEVAHTEKNRGILPDIEYKIANPERSFTLEQLKEMLKLIEGYKMEKNVCVKSAM